MHVRGGDEDLISAARALAPEAAAAAQQAEHDRRLPLDLVARFREAGLFKLLVPRALGGTEADPATMVEVVETLSAADAAAGWCVMIAATSGVLAAYLDETGAKEIYGPAESITGGAYAAKGTAVAHDGGHLVSGRWQWGSGAQHCTWIMGGALVDGGRVPHLFVFPAADVEVIDTWRASGLRGTGSNDFTVNDLFVPGTHSASLAAPPREHGPLYRFPVFGLLALGVGSVTLGIARAAIDELVDLAGGKVPTGHVRRLADRAPLQADVAKAEALLRSARALVFDAVGTAYAVATAGDPLTVEHRRDLRLAATNAARSSAAAVDLMYEAGGGTSVYETSPLQCYFRNVHVATQHMLVAPATLELVGRLTLGLDTDTSEL